VSAAPRLRFFGGKGGVGKTTCAAAAALAAADERRRVLLVSTDPAHSLADALGARLTARPRRLPTPTGSLAAVELDADRALVRWLAERRRPLRTIADRGTYLDEDDVDRLLALSLPGVDELVGLIELHRLARSGPYDDVVVDTAPTGHTLRLLAMPETLARIAAVLADMLAKHRFLGESLGGAHRQDAADELVAELQTEAETLHALLRDRGRASFSWVLLPEPVTLAETLDGVRALAAARIVVDELIVNRLTPPRADCALCRSRAAGEAAVVRRLRRALPGYRVRLVAAADAEPRGLAALRRLAAARPPRLAAPRTPSPRRVTGTGAPAWLDALAPPGVRVLAVAGKGGVGKTSVAAAVALGLAARRPDARLLLLSTDPAHSLADVLGVPLGDDERAVPGAPRLAARELDAEAAFRVRRERYEKAVDELVDALLRASPPPYDMVVVDTAPTGHALRLLAMPAGALEWVHALLAILLKYRTVLGLGELASDLLDVARELRELSALLRDAARTRVVVVARPAALPRLETGRLLRGLRRLALPIGGLVVNAVTPPGCARCRRAAAREARETTALHAAARSAAGRQCAIITSPAESPPPGGVEGLRDWLRRWQWRA
jgi:arsenite-transporting ATPase